MSLGLGWMNSFMYLRLKGLALYSTMSLAQYGYGASIGSGYRWRWLKAGLSLRLQRQASDVDAPAADQSLSLFAETEQCLYGNETIQVCFREAFAPLSIRYRDASFAQGQLVRIDTKVLRSMQAELGLILKFIF